MMNGFPRPTELAQAWIREVLGAGDVAVDATTGNGHDTRFLAECVTSTGMVHAFDVQQLALDAAKKHCAEHQHIQWHLASHATLESCVSSARAVMFNLGYLPGADHACMTHADETLAAIDAACRILQGGGRITIVCYPGHRGGDEETAAVLAHVAGLGATWHIVKYEKIGTRNAAPILLGLSKHQTWEQR
jgi:ubiquinone/menaquinone biosynthesis C-methylase UbiE